MLRTSLKPFSIVIPGPLYRSCSRTSLALTAIAAAVPPGQAAHEKFTHAHLQLFVLSIAIFLVSINKFRFYSVSIIFLSTVRTSPLRPSVPHLHGAVIISAGRKWEQPEGSGVKVRDDLNMACYGKEVRPVEIIVQKKADNPGSAGFRTVLEKGGVRN